MHTYQPHLDVHGGVLVDAAAPVANLFRATAGAVCPGEVAGLTHKLPAGLPGAPQLGAGLHVGAGLGARAEGKLALAVQAVGGAREAFVESHLLLRLVQQTVSCRDQAQLNTAAQGSSHTSSVTPKGTNNQSSVL